jgi:hypothetical protein
MASKEVIRAAQMFTTSGVASRTSVVKEIAIGMGLGLAFGMVWQVRGRVCRGVGAPPAGAAAPSTGARRRVGCSPDSRMLLPTSADLPLE